MRTFSKTIRNHPSSKTGSQLPTDMQWSSSSPSESVDQLISNRWEYWLPAVRLSLGSLPVSSPTGIRKPSEREISLEAKQKEHRLTLERLLRVGLTIKKVREYNLDSPLISVEEREQWIQVFQYRKENK